MQQAMGTILLTLFAVALLGGVITGAMVGCPAYNVYSKTKAGEAKLREAESSRKILIEEAKALKEAARFQAEAEVERARGVAEANEIIGTSLKDNDEYLRYLWINGLHDSNSEVIYVATEAALPITEANRLAVPRAAPTPVEEQD